MNKCDICSNQVEHRRSDIDNPYRYTECGLPNVNLLDLDVYYCPECEIEVADIPNPEGLHRLLATEILLNPLPISGAEFRFLRKELGMKPKTFADRIGVDPKTIINWEKSASLSKQNDILVRYIVATSLLEGERLRKAIELLNTLIEDETWEQTEQEIAELAETNTWLGITGTEWMIGPDHA